MRMKESAPKAIKILVPAMVFAAFVIAVILRVMVLAAGFPSSWAIGIFFAFLVALVIVRIIAYAGYGYPRYDFSQQYYQSKSYLFDKEPEKALEAKYARGEISKEQYQQMLDDLRGKK
jgi:cell division protein FtsW (lipid II flippase)